MDPRWYRLGNLLAQRSTAIQKGDKVLISMGEVGAFPLCAGVYEAAVKAGANAQVIFSSESLYHSLMEYGDDSQVEWLPEVESSAMDWADVYIGLRGAYDFAIHSSIPDPVLARHQQAMGKISAKRWNIPRWVLCRVPNEGFARQAGTDLATMIDMFFDACFVDMDEMAVEMRRLARILEGGRTIRIVGKDTDIEFSIAGRKWITADGKINMPDGELFTAPVHESVHGRISFEHPGVFAGRLMEGLRLEWDHGVLTSASASTNNDFFQAVLKTDAGAASIGEFAFGFNDRIDRFCNDILFDEKIGGSVHIALGRAYPASGGTNKSAIHLDIVKDMRDGGSVLLDGRLIYDRGRFLV